MSKGVVVPPGGGKHLEEKSGQVMSMKLFGRETGESVTLFEQAVPAGSKNSWLHLHRDSDEIAWVGNQPGRVVFLYTPAGAGRFVEGMLERPTEGDLKKRLDESGWEVLGLNPL